MTLFLGFGALLVLWQGSRDVIQGRITVGQLVAFNAYLVMLSWPMIAFGWVTNMLQRGSASWGRMLEILDAPPDDRRSAEAGVAGPGFRRPDGIEIRGPLLHVPDATTGSPGHQRHGRARPDSGHRGPDGPRQVDAAALLCG